MVSNGLLKRLDFLRSPYIGSDDQKGRILEDLSFDQPIQMYNFIVPMESLHGCTMSYNFTSTMYNGVTPKLRHLQFHE